MKEVSNPFIVTTPENLEDQEIVNLFVPYPEFDALQGSGHQFLNGHRGSGKSMMLRMMTPGCQMIEQKCSISELRYFGVYLSIKATELNTQEYMRLDHHRSGAVISEHLLCVKLLSSLFKSLKKFYEINEVNSFNKCYEKIYKILYFSGESLEKNLKFTSKDKFFDYILNVFDQIQSTISQYIKRSAFNDSILPFNGSLLGFLDTVVPIIEALKEHSLIQTKVVYFLLDDADNLSITQTKVLNTWVSYRTTATVALKISTQLNYKTKETTSGQIIEAPHDYSSIEFTSVLTGSPKKNYPKLVADVIEKRLKKAGIEDITANDFFPTDSKQEEAIKKIAQDLINKWDAGEGRGNRAGDDAYRYARPEYIRRLSQKKGSYHYLYAGFDQLVHMSSGIIRYFLEPAGIMFSEQQKINGSTPVTKIDPSIQDKQMRAQADYLFINRFSELQEDSEAKKAHGWTDIKFEKLHNLIEGLGMLFQSYVMDEKRSQRRTYSFQFSEKSTPTRELMEIIKLGVSLGYFDEDSIGNKSGFGRTKLYYLTRRIAPIFKLDPMGMSHNISVETNLLLEMTENPDAYKKRAASNKQQDLNFSN